MTDLWTKLKKTHKPIFIYGMGNGAQKLLNVLKSYDIKASGIFASDGFVRDKCFHGFKIQSYNEVCSKNKDIIVLTAFGTNRRDVIDNIKNIAAECELYSPDLPVYGGEIFSSDFYDAHIQDFNFVRSKLHDDMSRLVFDNIIKYKLSGNISYLFKCESEKDEAFKNILKLGQDEVFVDLGAYRGDTVNEFLNHVGKYKRIYAVEPDKKTYDKLVRLLSDKKINCINAAAGAKSETVFFEMKGGRSSHISDSGTKIQTLAADDILDGAAATYIKMDVEGAERDAISGAKQTILNFKPRLRIAAYHRTGDIFNIVKQVLEIRDDYKVYMRHHPYIPAWDTDYYFI